MVLFFFFIFISFLPLFKIENIDSKLFFLHPLAGLLWFHNPQRGATASHQMLIRMSPDRVSYLLLIQMPMKPQNQEASSLVLSSILRYDF